MEDEKWLVAGHIGAIFVVAWAVRNKDRCDDR